MIGRIRAKAGPRFFDPCVCKLGRKLDGRRKYFFDPSSRRPLVKADILDGSPREDSSVISRNKINVFRPEDALDFQVLRTEGNHLALRWPHGRIRCDSLDR